VGGHENEEVSQRLASLHAMGAATAPRGSAPQPVLTGDTWRYMERNVRASPGGRVPEGETASRVRLG